MSIHDKAKNAKESAKGAAKDVAGRVSDDRSLEAEGKAQRAKGDLKQAGEKVKDAIKAIVSEGKWRRVSDGGHFLCSPSVACPERVGRRAAPRTSPPRGVGSRRRRFRNARWDAERFSVERGQGFGGSPTA